MKTEDLITMLSQDAAPTTGAGLTRRTLLGLGGGLIVAAALFLTVLGPRAALGAAMSDPVTLAKTLIPLALAALALPLALRTARPGAAPGPMAHALWAPPVLAALLWLWDWTATAPGWRMIAFTGHSIHVCLPAITLLSLPILAGLTAALRHGAPEHPVRTGAFAGLTAAGLATSIYSTVCTEDSPLFYAAWYGLGIAIATGLGALVGHRWLRW